MSTELHLPHTRVFRILKKNHFKSYKVHISHTLRPGDENRRLRYCNWLVERIANDPDFLSKVIWTDESRFTNCGFFNRNNKRLWSIANPRRNMPRRNQIRFGINVWAGLYKNRVIGPLLFEGNLNGERYLNFLRTEFANYIDDTVPLRELPGMWLQQDGAPPHNTRAVRDYLNEHFQQQWIGNNGAEEWPARSGDLSPLDFFLWGTVKNRVYENVPGNLQELRRNIENAFASIRHRDVARALEHIRKRITKCINVNGGLFEHLM